MNRLEVVFVALGVYQPHIKFAIRNLRLFGNNNITILADSHLLQHFSDIKNIRLIDTSNFDLQYFDELSKLDDQFRRGFWKNTSKRLFYLYHYMKKYARRNCVHIENDVMVYKNLQSLIPKTDKVWLVMDTEDRSVPSIIFIPDYRLFENLVKNYWHDQDDMRNMAHFFNDNKELCNTFPTIKQNTHYNHNDIFSTHFETFHALFDGVSIGQYLGGIDPRNTNGKTRKRVIRLFEKVGLRDLKFLNKDTRGFVNETCMVDYSKYLYAWIKESGNFVPHIKIEMDWIPIVNLHIHSKWLKNFYGKNPKETKFIPIVN